MKKITGKDNNIIKLINNIRRNPSKMEEGQIFIEGEKILFQMIDLGIVFDLLIISEKYKENISEKLLKNAKESIILADNLFSKISFTKTPSGIAALVKSPVLLHEQYYKDFIEDKIVSNIFVLQDIQDPGNFGNIIRSCDAFGIDGIIYTKGNVNPFNEKVIRATMGSIFNVPLIFTENLEKTVKYFKDKEFTVYGLDLNGETITRYKNFANKALYIFGNEGNGIYPNVLEICDKKLTIPMKGKAESLNVSSAASIIAHLICK